MTEETRPDEQHEATDSHGPALSEGLAMEVLERLARFPAAREIVLGGYLALRQHVDYRKSHDIDAWWRTARNAGAEAAVRNAMQEVAERHGLILAERQFGEVLSFELVSGTRKVFSFQIAPRSVQISEPVLSAWPPLLMETLEDNVASKMNALINRGAPRDFLDIRKAVATGIMPKGRCWELWQQKNPGQPVAAGQQKASLHLAALETRRPLESISDPQEQEQAAEVRSWFRETFLK